MMKKMKIATILRKDEGLSLAEILVSVGLTGLLALGCTQLALASFTSASYTEAIAMKSVDSGNANRMVTTDMESASGFLVPSKSGALPATSQCTTSSSNSVRPLVTLAYANGNMVGYEVRTNADSGSLWRIACPTAGNPTGTERWFERIFLSQRRLIGTRQFSAQHTLPAEALLLQDVMRIQCSLLL